MAPQFLLPPSSIHSQQNNPLWPACHILSSHPDDWRKLTFVSHHCRAPASIQLPNTHPPNVTTPPPHTQKYNGVTIPLADVDLNLSGSTSLFKKRVNFVVMKQSDLWCSPTSAQCLFSVPVLDSLAPNPWNRIKSTVDDTLRNAIECSDCVSV